MKILTNYRYYVLWFLAIAITITLVYAPSDTLPIGIWTAKLIISKAICAVMALLLVRLYANWSNSEKINELTNLIKE